MGSIRCPFCLEMTEMRHFLSPPYRATNARIAELIGREQPDWNPAAGFCRACALKFRRKLMRREQIAEQILTAIERLPALQKKVFVLYHYRGLKAEEVGLQLRIEKERVNELLMKASRALYQSLHPFIEPRRIRAEPGDPVP